MLQIIVALAIVGLGFALAMSVAPQGWRTVVFNAIASLPMIGATVADALSGFDWTRVLDGKAASIAGLAILVLNVALRAMTSTPIGKPL